MELADEIMDIITTPWPSSPNERGAEPLWITYEQAIAIHVEQLRRFGGATGLRDEGMLDRRWNVR